MKVNHKTLTSALFALLMFSVAVSGGCGGGGGGNPVSQDTITLPDGVTTQYVSPDVLLSSPDVISSDDLFVSGDSNAGDEYGDGDGDVTQFTLLNRTTWDIVSLRIRRSGSTINQDVRQGNNYDTTTVTFFTSGNPNAMAWATSGNKKTLIYDDLTVLFKDDTGAWQTAPILRHGQFSAIKRYGDYQDVYRASIGAGTEILGLKNAQPQFFKVPQYVEVVNQFRDADGKAYESFINLERLDNFLILDQTDWKIRDIQVFGMVRGADGNYTTITYPITRNDYQNYIITLYTSQSNSSEYDKEYLLQYRYRSSASAKDNQRNTTLTARFQDPTNFNAGQELLAPFLRSGSGFRYKEEQGDFQLFEGILKNSDIPGNEVVFVSQYGTNAHIIIDNSIAYIGKNNQVCQYWVRLTLDPTYLPD